MAELTLRPCCNGIGLASIGRNPQDVPSILTEDDGVIGFPDRPGGCFQSITKGYRRPAIDASPERLVVIGPQVESITSKPVYTPLFVLGRRERFNGEMGVIWLPGQDSNLQPSG